MGVLRAVQMGDFDRAARSQSIFNCLSCNRCMTNCPNSKDSKGMNFAELIRNLRAYAWSKQIAVEDKPQSAGVGSVIGMKCDTKGNPLQTPILNTRKYIEGFKGLKTAEVGKIAYVVGDLPLFEERYSSFGFNYAEIPRNVVKILNQVHVTPVFLNLMPTAHDDLWTGNVNFFQNCAQSNVEICRKAGVKTIIIEDSDTYRTWKYDYPKAVPEFEFEVFHLSEFLMQDKNFEKLTFQSNINAHFVFQDNSRLGRLGDKLYFTCMH